MLDGTGPKRCPKCGEVKPLTEFSLRSDRPGSYRSQCKGCDREATRRRYAANPEVKREDARRRYAVDREASREAMRRRRAARPEAARESWRRSYATNAEAKRAATRRRYAADRETVFDHYGRSCACCGAIERLTIDHVCGDGQQHREQIGATNSAGLYRWLIANGFPQGFQTLCAPCNGSKGTGLTCRLSHCAVTA